MPDASGHSRYSVDTASVLALAERLCAAAGDAAGDFVLAAIDARDGAIQHHTIPNGPDAGNQIVELVARIGAQPYQNMYFAGSLFRSGAIIDNTGRTKKNVIGVLCAVAEFDAKNDPATRAARLPLPASSELESSPGNFHVHYWFDRPHVGNEIEPALYALADVTGADDCKSTEHLWRCPGTWNWPNAKKIAAGRSSEPFQARWTHLPLEAWEGSVTAEELSAAILARDPSAFARPHASTSDPADFDWNRRKRLGEPVALLEDAAIVRALSKEGDRSKSAATFIRRCWKANYSAEEIADAMLKYGNLPVMGHYSGEVTIRADVQRIIGKPDPTERRAEEVFKTIIAKERTDGSIPLRAIHVEGGALAENVNAAEAALIEQGVPIYQRGSFLVRRGEVVIERRDGESVKEELLVPVTQPALIETMTSAAQFVRWDARMEDWKRINCPKEIGDAYLARTGLWRMRPLMGVTRTPMLRQDGTILDTLGYDAATGFIYDPRGVAFPPIPAEPSQDEARAALTLFDELIGKFPFASPEGRAVALAAFLTSCIRPTLSTAPLFGIDGTGQGSGKGLLVDTASVVGSGSPAASITTGADGAELEKRVGPLLLSGAPSLSIDNVTKPLESDFLAMLLTQPAPMMRILGQSKIVRVPSNAMLFATGNGLTCGGDMWRRVLVCLIDPAMERPSSRSFDFNPVERALRNRPRYVNAALTVLRAYHVAGAPAQKGQAMGSFADWCRRVRDPLLWLGEADAAATCAPPADDPERERFASVILAWQAVIGEGRGVTLKQAIMVAIEAACAQPPHPELLDAFHAVAAPMVRGADSKIDARRLGEWVRTKKRSVGPGGLRLVPDGITDGVARWRLERARGRSS